MKLEEKQEGNVRRACETTSPLIVLVLTFSNRSGGGKAKSIEQTRDSGLNLWRIAYSYIGYTNP